MLIECQTKRKRAIDILILASYSVKSQTTTKGIPYMEHSEPHPAHVTLGDDLLWGTDAIAAELKLTRRQAQHQLECRSIPAGKQLGRWVASRRALRAHFERLMTEIAA